MILLSVLGLDETSEIMYGGIDIDYLYSDLYYAGSLGSNGNDDIMSASHLAIL